MMGANRGRRGWAASHGQPKGGKMPPRVARPCSAAYRAKRGGALTDLWQKGLQFRQVLVRLLEDKPKAGHAEPAWSRKGL